MIALYRITKVGLVSGNQLPRTRDWYYPTGTWGLGYEDMLYTPNLFLLSMAGVHMCLMHCLIRASGCGYCWCLACAARMMCIGPTNNYARNWEHN